MEKDRWRGIAFIFVILLCILGYFLVDRMIIRKNDFASARYSDKRFIELMDDLINKSIFKIEGKAITIDEDALAKINLNKQVVDRVRNNARFLYVKKGELKFDKLSASIMNTRDKNEVTVFRGMFLDRNAYVLAKSVPDKKPHRYKRQYMLGPEFFPIIGYSNPVFHNRNLEKVLDDHLNGADSSNIEPSPDNPLKKIKYGDDVYLTIDNKVQTLAYKLMSKHKGSVVVLDVKTGEILAAVSLPSFDPNTADEKIWRDTFGETGNKLYENRSFSALYQPGSTFKTVVAAAWLETSVEALTVNCTGHKSNRYGISDIHSHGSMTIDNAFAKSCNQFFSEIGVQLGPELLRGAERFGFNKTINLIPQIPGSSYYAQRSLAFSWYGRASDKVETYQSRDFKRNRRIVAQCAIGQNLVVATPLQMAMIAAAVANKGVVLNPNIVKLIKAHNGQQTLFNEPVTIGKAMSESVAGRIKKMMESVMVKGTGANVKKVYLENNRYTTIPETAHALIIAIAGKTGTAEIGDKNKNCIIGLREEPHSWFIGFAPAKNPRIAIAVIAENQGHGSLTAAPIAVDVLAEALNSININ